MIRLSLLALLGFLLGASLTASTIDPEELVSESTIGARQ